MNKISNQLTAGTLLILGLSLAGCGDGGISKQEVDSIKTSPKMTKQDWDKVGNGMAEGARKRAQSQSDWAKSNPEKAAQINAERAKMGRPPLGGSG